MVGSLHRNVLAPAARPANRTEALARLPDATSKHLKETGSFNYRIFAELESYLNQKLCQVAKTAAQPKKSLNGVRGIANVLVSARHPSTVTLTLAEAMIAHLKMRFSFSGAVRSTDTDKFNPLFDRQMNPRSSDVRTPWR